MKRKHGWSIRQKDKVFNEIVAGGRGGAMPPMELHQDEWWSMKTSWSDNDSSAALPHTDVLVLKRNDKNYKGGTHKTRFYVDSTEFVNRKINKGHI